MSKIAFRTDGSPQIGMGHVMRCLSLAKAFRQAGCTVEFISKYMEGIKAIQDNFFDVFCIESGKQDQGQGIYFGDKYELDTDLVQIKDFMERSRIDLLIVDSYNITDSFFLLLKSLVKKIAYIDDINSFTYPVDILINGNINAEYLGYEKYSEDELMLLGPAYNLIREEFRNIPARTVNNYVQELMITMGGADPFDMSSKIVEAIFKREQLKGIRVNLIVGGAFRHKEYLYSLAKKHENLFLYENPNRISEIMLRSDIAISAGGSTLYELAACGTPTLSLILAENQVGIVEKMVEEGYIESLGWYNQFSANELFSKLSPLMDYNVRLIYSMSMQKLVDGKGTQRIVQKILDAV